MEIFAFNLNKFRAGGVKKAVDSKWNILRHEALLINFPSGTLLIRDDLKRIN